MMVHLQDLSSQANLARRPTPLEYFSFVLTYWGLIAGPPFLIKEYLEYQRLEGPFAALPKVSLLRPFPFVFLKTLVAATGLVLHMTVFPTSEWTSERVAAMALPRKLVLLCVGSSLSRFRNPNRGILTRMFPSGGR